MFRLLILFVLAAGLLLPTQAAAFPRSFAPQFSYDQAAAWATQFDAALDALPEDLNTGITNGYQMNLWIQEVVPYFEYEGIVLPGQAVYPPSAEFTYYDTGLYHNHVLGTTLCFTSAITMNARIANRVSSWYGRSDSLGTLVHELAHAQGICFNQARLDSETSAQLVTLEILAALSNRGNVVAFAVLLEELAYMSLAAAKYAAIDEDRFDEYVALTEELLDPFERASHAKSERFWAATNPDRLVEILYSYNFAPMEEVWRALRTTQTIEGVDLPINRLCTYAMYAPAYNERWEESDDEPSEYTCELYPLVIDDLAYVIANLDDLLGAF